MLPLTDGAGTYRVAERVRSSVAGLCEPHALSASGIVTVSIGIVAFVPVAGESAEGYLELADAALYEAKRRGRNQVVGGPTVDPPGRESRAA